MDGLLIKDISLLLNIVGAGICFLMSLAFFRKNMVDRSYENSILSFLFFIIGFIISNTVLNITGYSQLIRGFEPISNALCLALAPLLYLYIRQLSAVPAHNWIISFHLIPFYGYLTLTILLLLFPNWSPALNGEQLFMGKTVVVIWNIQFATYLIYGYRSLRKTSIKVSPNATLIYWGIASIWIVNTILFFYRNLISELPQIVYLNITLLFTILTLRIAFRELNSENVRRSSRRIGKKPELLLEDSSIILEIEENKYYRDAELDIRKLAKLLDMPYHQLSRTINARYQKNFNEFINGFRVREVVDGLTTEQKYSYTIMGLAQKAGFRSGSAFYSAFRKELGTTPKLFLQARLAGNAVLSSDL